MSVDKSLSGEQRTGFSSRNLATSGSEKGTVSGRTEGATGKQTAVLYTSDTNRTVPIPESAFLGHTASYSTRRSLSEGDIMDGTIKTPHAPVTNGEPPTRDQVALRTWRSKRWGISS